MPDEVIRNLTAENVALKQLLGQKELELAVLRNNYSGLQQEYAKLKEELGSGKNEKKEKK